MPCAGDVLVGEEAPLALGPLADKSGGGLRVVAAFMDGYPVRGGEQFEAVGGLESVDQLGDALVALARLGVIRQEGFRLLHGAGQQAHARVTGAVAEAGQMVSLEAFDRVPRGVGVGPVALLDEPQA